MTREAKIGLLVGMGSIIFIGILISDHLSVAQQQNNAVLAQAQPVETVYVPATLPAPLVDTRLAQQYDPAVPALNPQDFQLNRTQDQSPAPSTSQPPTHDTLILTTDNSILSQDGVAQVDTPMSSSPRTVSTPVAPRPTGKVHHVQTGDTLWSIAAKYYGDGNYFQSIYEANRDKMKSPTDLRTGVRLIIPDRGGSTSSPADTQPIDSSPQTFTVAVADTPRTSSPKTYTVQTGDTLGEISQQVYGTSKKWRDLYNNNKDRIKNPDVLIVGTQLRVNR